MHSYHIFYFPFIWENPAKAGKVFAEQIDLSAIKINPYTNWLRCPEMNETEKQDFYNEQNYFYKFVHNVLYDNKADNSLIRHYERKEPKEHEVTYTVAVNNGKTYSLKLDAMNLNLYDTGVGMLTFHLANNSYSEPQDILNINQYGRRIFPPFFSDIDRKGEIAKYLQITGLNGEQSNFYEDFSSYKKTDNNNLYQSRNPACFIRNLIADLSEMLVIKPVIDDRMFVNCWYKNDDLTTQFGETTMSLDEFFAKDDFWYKYLFVDGNYPTCQNDEMRKQLLNKQTYKRWQKWSSLYGISRYSFVMLSNNTCPDYLLQYFQTMYARMTEVVLLQRASRLRFSDEVNRVSQLSKNNVADKKIVEQVSSLYREYIRFINRVYFKDVTAQEQGIELYEMFFYTMNMKDYVKELDEEIAELNEYVNLLDDKIRNRNAELLNYIAAAFLPATAFFSLLSANNSCWDCSIYWKLTVGISLSAIMLGILLIKKKK
ncbi:MAG: hypothetical protein LBC89_05310 [Bacteroidales bacterium]|jgi:hypothetical protein|nr:hypothetical protein [Bacteroidales bacterium]